jgi:hypothetical protein
MGVFKSDVQCVDDGEEDAHGTQAGQDEERPRPAR